METYYIVGWVPWPVAAAAAIWFGMMAHKSAKNRVLWAIGGGLLGLVLTTIVLGLGQATFIPYYSDQVSSFRLKAALLAIVLVICVGWLFTGTLHRHLFASRKQGAEPATEPLVKPTAPAPKQ
jgi:MFS superfamily sulfate permease-like transporter